MGMVEEKGDAWRFISSCFVLGCGNGGIMLIRSRMGALFGGAPYKYRREPKSIKIYKGRRR
ncbi:MAG: hypothetical protein N2V73_00550 [Candidatus Methanospirare jalkutatii]|nr:hypothetical protein [Candidatus Methanospirare jalkutatii]MCW7079589.1 hypothetical protein [Candidatus Methanospirare jalkutatii]